MFAINLLRIYELARIAAMYNTVKPNHLVEMMSFAAIRGFIITSFRLFFHFIYSNTSRLRSVESSQKGFK